MCSRNYLMGWFTLTFVLKDVHLSSRSTTMTTESVRTWWWKVEGHIKRTEISTNKMLKVWSALRCGRVGLITSLGGGGRRRVAWDQVRSVGGKTFLALYYVSLCGYLVPQWQHSSKQYAILIASVLIDWQLLVWQQPTDSFHMWVKTRGKLSSHVCALKNCNPSFPTRGDSSYGHRAMWF